jgi:site-specific DNA-methyltransferase (adenine-specific)
LGKYSDSLQKFIGHRVYFKSCEDMSEIPDEAVQAIVTSPPYWNLKNYAHPNQIGFGEPYEIYLRRLNRVWLQCKRVLNETGTMWVIASNVKPRGEWIQLPYDIVQSCQRIGFHLQDIAIWNKPTAIAGLASGSLVNKFENVLFFSKSKRSFKLRSRIKAKGSSPDYEFNRLTNFWRLPVKAGSIGRTLKHKAYFPEELVKRIIEICTDKDDLVLDPFLGSGTTMLVALKLKREFVGYEITRRFLPLIRSRLYRI